MAKLTILFPSGTVWLPFAAEGLPTGVPMSVIAMFAVSVWVPVPVPVPVPDPDDFEQLVAQIAAIASGNRKWVLFIVYVKEIKLPQQPPRVNRTKVICALFRSHFRCEEFNRFQIRHFYRITLLIQDHNFSCL